MTEMHSGIYSECSVNCWVNVSRYYSIKFNSSFMPFHAHDELEIMYAAAGQCTVFLETGESYLLKEGDYIFLDSNVSHKLYINAGEPCRVLNIEGNIEKCAGVIRFETLLKDEKFHRFMQAKQPVFVSHDRERIILNSLTNMIRLMDRDASPIEKDLQLSLIFAEMGRQYALNSAKPRRAGMPVYVRQSIEYINQNYDQPITVTDIVNAAGVSKSHLQREFHRHTNSTILEMINGLRLNKAMFLLETTKLSMVDIAVSVGFGSRCYFTDLFTRTFDVSPARYRKHRETLNIVRGHFMNDFQM